MRFARMVMKQRPRAWRRRLSERSNTSTTTPPALAAAAAPISAALRAARKSARRFGQRTRPLRPALLPRPSTSRAARPPFEAVGGYAALLVDRDPLAFPDRLGAEAAVAAAGRDH